MTVIAWDGKTLAADKLVTFGFTRGITTKIFRVNGHLLGIAGGAAMGMEMVEWFRNGADPAKYPAHNRAGDDKANLLVIRPDGTAWKYEIGGYPYPMEGPFCSAGVGDESALIAMACGKTAKEAVLLVSQYNGGCGMGVDTLELDK